MKLAEFDYSLPQHLIADEPVTPRDNCKLLVVGRESGVLKHDRFFNIWKYLRSGDTIVLNKTKVIPCRLRFDYKEKLFEIFITDFKPNNEVIAMVFPGKFFKKRQKIEIAKDIIVEVIDILPDGLRILRFDSAKTPFELMKEIGMAPFPPYIGHTNASFEDYQTVYAENEGSLASPTAGLHITKRLLSVLQSKGIEIEYVTLNVGLGTFLPVKAENIFDHKMHKESYEMTESTARRLNEIKRLGGRVVAVGTTSVRVLESCFDKGLFSSCKGETDIFIYPGYKWRCVDGMVTNFHLPKSTLMMLVSSFGGYDVIRDAYREAIKKHYRFYSFGDAMLII